MAMLNDQRVYLVGGLEHGLIFFGGIAFSEGWLNHQPDMWWIYNIYNVYNPISRILKMGSELFGG